MVSKVCSRSHGQPPGARSLAIMPADCSNNAAARAGSVFRSWPGSRCFCVSAVEVSSGSSMHPQSNAGPPQFVPQTRTSNRILNPRMIGALVTIFAGLLGLAFGSFLNVCLSRWPEGESIMSPRSHCRNCEHPLAWRENIPLLSWSFLRGRCHGCRAWISVRYPLVELAVGTLWAVAIWRATPWLLDSTLSLRAIAPNALETVGTMLFYWLLVALAALDAEHLWLPNKIT